MTYFVSVIDKYVSSTYAVTFGNRPYCILSSLVVRNKELLYKHIIWGVIYIFTKIIINLVAI